LWTVPFGSFRHALHTVERTALEPGVLDTKYYVAGIGEVAELSRTDPTERLTLVEIAAALTEISGTTIRYTQVTDEEYVADSVRPGCPSRWRSASSASTTTSGTTISTRRAPISRPSSDASLPPLTEGLCELFDREDPDDLYRKCGLAHS